MGYSDYLTCELELPGLGVPAGLTFQTKDLFGTGVRLTLTPAGRLIEHQARIEEAERKLVAPGVTVSDYRAIPLGDRDLEFHGDVRFYTHLRNGTFVQFVARFTHGQVEWIRSLGELSDTHRSLLQSR